ncbi:MAG: hypothetical protein ACE5GE_13690 [Phycisphaerae bacterium]
MLRDRKHNRPRLASVALVAVLAGFSSGCDDMDGKEFRAVAGPSLEQGLTTVVTGVIDAAFAGYIPDDIDNNSGVQDTDTTPSNP